MVGEPKPVKPDLNHRAATRIAVAGVLPAAVIVGYAVAGPVSELRAATYLAGPFLVAAALMLSASYRPVLIGQVGAQASLPRLIGLVVRWAPLWLGVILPLVLSVSAGAMTIIGLTTLVVLWAAVESLRRRWGTEGPYLELEHGDEYLVTGYRLRWDLFAAAVLILAVVMAEGTARDDADSRSAGVVVGTTAFLALYWNVFAAFETDDRLTAGQRGRTALIAALLLVPILLQSRLDHLWAIAASLLAVASFVGLAERGRREGIRLRTTAVK